MMAYHILLSPTNKDGDGDDGDHDVPPRKMRTKQPAMDGWED